TLFRSTVLPEAVANMGACSQSGAAYVTDHLTLVHALTPLHGSLAHVEVLCGVHVVVLNFDVIAVTPAVGRFDHDTGRGGHDRGAVGRREIGTQMRFPPALYRVEPPKRIPRRYAAVF